jgi:hypothetical protein
MYNVIKFGTVVDINDPEKLGRVKINVYGLHDNIRNEDLPWSMVMMPGNTPAKDGIGSSVNLLIGTLVAGLCLDKSQQEFLVLGTIPTKTAGIDDNNVRVKGEADPNTEDTTGLYQPPSTYAPVYPYNNVMETECGHVKEYDDTPGVERITERHKSGTRYEIDPNGTKNETIVRDNYKLVAGHDTLEVYGNVKIVVSGDVDIAVAGSLTASVTGNITADSQGDITLKATETDKKIILDGDVDVTKVLRTNTDGADINLNTHIHTQPDTGADAISQGDVSVPVPE